MKYITTTAALFMVLTLGGMIHGIAHAERAVAVLASECFTDGCVEAKCKPDEMTDECLGAGTKWSADDEDESILEANMGAQGDEPEYTHGHWCMDSRSF